jgi:hypothetical protein
MRASKWTWVGLRCGHFYCSDCLHRESIINHPLWLFGGFAVIHNPDPLPLVNLLVNLMTAYSSIHSSLVSLCALLLAITEDPPLTTT